MLQKNNRINKEVMLYLLITYGIIIVLFICSLVFKLDYKQIVPLTMIIPTLAAIVSTLIFKDKFDYIKDNLKINKWTIVGPIIILIIFVLVKLMEILIYKYILRSQNLIIIPNAIIIIKQILIGIFIGGLSAMLEEIGWRGFLINKLENNFIGYLKIGIYWSIFHIPQVLIGLIYNNHAFYGIIIQTLLLITFNFTLCYIRKKSKSIINTAIMHGIFNSLIFTQSISIICGVDQLLEGILWMVSFMILSIVLLKRDNKYINEL